jgi:hypothetical protein
MSGFGLAGISASAALATMVGFGLAVLALYFLKLRRRPIEVPFVHLFREVLATERSSRLFANLRRVLSLLLALLFVALVTGALVDPRPTGSEGSGRIVILALDASASMQATDVAGGRFEAARTEARRLIETLGATDRAIVIEVADEARPLSSVTSSRAELETAIAAATPHDVGADLAEAARFARDVASGSEHAELVVVSDGRMTGVDEARAILGDAGISARHVSVGTGGANVAITALAVRRYPLDASRNEVLLELLNAGSSAETVEVELLGDGATVDVQHLSIGPGARERRFFAGLTGVDQALEARLRRADGTTDALAVDDRFYARVPERRRARIALVSEDDVYLQAALLLDEYLDVVEVAPSAFPPAEAYDVAILDRFVPAAPLDHDAIYLSPAPPDGVEGPLEITGTLERPFFDVVHREHPLLRHAAIADVNVARALLVRPRADDTVVAGDTRGPLLVTGTRGESRFVALTFDVRESDLPLRAAFPVLLLNAIDSFAETDAAYRGSVTTGTAVTVGLPAGATTATLDGARLAVRDGRASARFERAGFHTLVTDVGEQVVAANLTASGEADLTPITLELGPPSSAVAAAPAAALGLAPWQWLALLALGLLLVEWATFHRRLTV